MVHKLARSLLALGLLGWFVAAALALTDTGAPAWIKWTAFAVGIWALGMLVAWGVVYGGARGPR